jgi:hypothetical protein
MGQVAGLPPQTLINRGRRVARKRLGVRCSYARGPEQCRVEKSPFCWSRCPSPSRSTRPKKFWGHERSPVRPGGTSRSGYWRLVRRKVVSDSTRRASLVHMTVAVTVLGAGLSVVTGVAAGQRGDLRPWQSAFTGALATGANCNIVTDLQLTHPLVGSHRGCRCHRGPLASTRGPRPPRSRAAVYSLGQHHGRPSGGGAHQGADWLRPRAGQGASFRRDSDSPPLGRLVWCG